MINIAKQLIGFLFKYEEIFEFSGRLLLGQEELKDYGDIAYYLEKELKQLPQVKSLMKTKALTQSDPSGIILSLTYKEEFLITTLDNTFYTEDDEEFNVKFDIKFNRSGEAIEIKCDQVFYSGKNALFNIKLGD